MIQIIKAAKAQKEGNSKTDNSDWLQATWRPTELLWSVVLDCVSNHCANRSSHKVFVFLMRLVRLIVKHFGVLVGHINSLANSGIRITSGCDIREQPFRSVGQHSLI